MSFHNKIEIDGAIRNGSGAVTPFSSTNKVVEALDISCPYGRLPVGDQCPDRRTLNVRLPNAQTSLNRPTVAATGNRWTASNYSSNGGLR